jgi:hypothetical protein
MRKDEGGRSRRNEDQEGNKITPEHPKNSISPPRIVVAFCGVYPCGHVHVRVLGPARVHVAIGPHP